MHRLSSQVFQADTVDMALFHRIMFLSLAMLSTVSLFPTDCGAGRDRTFAPPELPGPGDEFAVQGYDAVQAVWMLRRTGFIQLLDSPGNSDHQALSRRTVTVRTARVVCVAPHLYTIYVNGEPMDWDHSYIRYNGRMTNLRLLFSYRNQPQPFAMPLYLD